MFYPTSSPTPHPSKLFLLLNTLAISTKMSFHGHYVADRCPFHPYNNNVSMSFMETVTTIQNNAVKYYRRTPELTTCYKILQENLNSFIDARYKEGRPIIDYVVDEFDEFMRCGMPQFGFLRIKCSECSKAKIVAFSCKNRGFCPSCCAKRMSETASHLVDNVLPLVPYRQFVISFPIPMRYWLNSNKKLFSKIKRIVLTCIEDYYKDIAIKHAVKHPHSGSIAFTQRWGSALNLNPHLHILGPDGVFTINSNGKTIFKNIPAMSDSDVTKLLTHISSRIMKYLQRLGFLDKDGRIIDNPTLDHLFQDNETIRSASHHSISGKIAFGPNTGKYVTKIGSGFGFKEEIPLSKGKLCYSVNGFSLHAATSTKTHQRDRLYKLIEYIARGPLSNERLKITPSNMVKLELKTHWSDGTTHLLFTPEEFIEKLSALIPPPRVHLVRWSGVFAPNSPMRKLIVLKPDVKKGIKFKDGDDKEHGVTSNLKNSSWAKMLARVFKVDVTKCAHCNGDMILLSAILDCDSIRRYLDYEGIDPTPPARAPPKISSDIMGHYDGHELSYDDLPIIYQN